MLACKICNKEMSLKFSSNWKKHHLTHASNEEKPHQCQLCNKGLITYTAYAKHMRVKHNTNSQEENTIKSEPFDMHSEHKPSFF